ncbi:MAG TPA: hypothetical protein VFH45_02135 [Acidimicrobiales bacterium]|nr:hypothetical protein [Acidimicrobiales bacterium]
MKPRGVVRAAVVVLVAGGVCAGWAAASDAQAPTSYGWWYAANAGLPVPPPPPPQVPPDGMYAQNGFNGPAAYSALVFTVPAGSAVGPLTLQIAPNSSISSPPVACALTGTFKSVQEGSWSSRPTYDCNKAQVPGTLNANQTAVSFNVDPFLHQDTVGLVVLAGGSADQIAFNKPGADALQVTAAGSGAGSDTGSQPAATPAPSSSPSGAGAQAPADSGSTAASPAPSDSSSFGASSLTSAGDLGSSAALPAPSTPSVPSGSQAASTGAQPATGGSSAGNRATSAVGAPTAAHSGGWNHKLATVLGAIAALVALLAWTEGFGLLGGRVQPLSERRRARRPRPAE